MLRKIYKEKKWFNAECRAARSTYHKTRKLYNKYKTTHYKLLLKTVSKEYKNKMSQNIRRYKNNRIEKLKNLKYAKPREFWKIINSIDEKNNKTAPLQDLYNYFKNINQRRASRRGVPGRRGGVLVCQYII